MRYSIVVLAAAVSAVYAQDSDDCQATYRKCIAAGTPEVVCSCNLTTCSGEDAARIREYCATATAGLVAATSSATASIVTGTIVQPSGAPQITAPAGSVALGQPCGADEQCGAGVQCFGSTAGTIRACGNFNSECTQDSQCAFNTCNNGLCNGFLPSSAYPAASSASSMASSASGPGATPNVPAVLAPEGSIRLGDQCSDTIQCASGAQCFGSTAGTIRACGNFNAPCTQDSQCAFNTCNNGLCNGFLASSAYPAATATAGGAAPHGNNGTIVAPTGGAANPTGSTRPASPSSSVTPYTGGASVGATFSGFAAVVAGVVAWAL
ncbi:hypothetical protein Slin15195_G120830 [Septoria linicola]|uniref:Uncharacterized protein n=1 Tax=Septoria linicola TaxID=215465 RepID=A0A9Q9B0R6_9PEZI|nr:hypothetical protein Slin15195_G120830 [Septoria linicola]